MRAHRKDERLHHIGHATPPLARLLGAISQFVPSAALLSYALRYALCKIACSHILPFPKILSKCLFHMSTYLRKAPSSRLPSNNWPDSKASSGQTGVNRAFRTQTSLQRMGLHQGRGVPRGPINAWCPSLAMMSRLPLSRCIHSRSRCLSRWWSWSASVRWPIMVGVDRSGRS